MSATQDRAVEPRRRRWRWLWPFVSLLVVLSFPLALGGWLLATEAGWRALAGAAERVSDGQVRIDAPSGRLLGPLQADRILVDLPDLRLQLTELNVEWSPVRLVERHLEVAKLSLGSVEVSVRPSDETEASGLPEALPLPGSLSIRHLELGRFALRDWQAPAASDDPRPRFEFSDLSLRASSDGRRHHVEALSVQLPFGAATLEALFDGGQSPFPLSAHGTLTGEHEARDFAIRFEATGDLHELALQVDAEGAGLQGEAEAVTAPFEVIPLRSLRVSVGEIDPSVFHEAAPRAALTASAELVPESTERWVLSGPIRIVNRLPETIDREGLPFSSIDARVRWSAEATRIDELAVRFAGEGSLDGQLEWWPDPVGESFGRLAALLDLAGLDPRTIDSRLPSTTVSGRIEATGDELRQDGRVELTVDEARIVAEGAFRPAAEEAVAAFELAGTLSAFDPSRFLAEAPEARLSLDFDAEGRLSEVPALRLAWTFRPSVLEGRSLGGSGRVEVEGERLLDGELVVDLAGNRVAAKGAWGAAGDTIAFEIDAPELSALGFDLSGRAQAAGRVGGSRAEPAGEIRLSASALVLPGEVRIDGVEATGRLEAGLDGPIDLVLGVRGVGKPDAEDWLRSASVLASGRRDAHGIEVALETPDADTLALQLEGALLAGSTGADAPAFAGDRWRGRVLALEAGGRFPVRLFEPADLFVSRERVALELARFDAGEHGRIRLDEATWSPDAILLRGGLTGLELQLTERRDRPDRPGGRERRGPGALALGAEWDVRLTETADGEIRVFRESGDLRLPGELSTRVGLEHLEAHLNLVANRIALAVDARGTEMGVVTGSVTAQAERTEEGMWRLAPDAAILGSARMDMPSVAWLARLLQEDLELAGALNADFSFSGTPHAPVAVGRIAGRDLSILMVDHGLQLSGGDLLAEFDRDRLRLTRLEFVSPNRVRPRDARVPVDALTQTPGRLTASGEIALESGRGDFRYEADRLPILQRTDRWLILSGEGTAASTWTSLDLKAAFRADAGYVELADTPPPTLSDDVVILGREEAPREGGLKLSADVTVGLGDQLYLSALGLDTRLTGELRIRLQEGQPLSAVGSIATVGGVFRGYGQNLALERGLINFQGPLDNPGLNVVALRKGLPVEAGISVLGSARRPQIRLVSEPNVPDPEKLSWIVLGRAPTAGAGADMGLLLPAAQALLGGSGGGMTDQLSRSLGFDEFGIGHGELGGVGRAPTSRVVGGGTTVTDEGTVSGQVLMLGKRLSTDLFLSFEQSLGGAESLVKLSYQLSRRVSLVARGGTDNSADLYYTVSFR